MALKLKGSTSGFVAVDCAAEGGNNTLILPDSNGVAGAVWANNATTAGVATCTSVTINKNGDLTVPGTVSVGGTITYEDVTNVDSVGIITARTDIHLGDKLVHYGDTNTAIRFPAADTISFETSGGERARITGIGSFGIGTNDPVTKLDVRGNIYFADNMLISNWDASGVGGSNIDHIWHSDASNNGTAGTWNFVSDGTAKQVGDSAIQIGYLKSSGGGYLLGSVGIGTTAARGATLEVQDAGATGPCLLLAGATKTEGDIAVPTGQNISIGHWNNVDTFTERLRITSTGKVGIGTDNPTQELVVGSSTFADILLVSGRSAATDQIGGFSFQSSAVGVTTATMNALVNGTILFKTAGEERMRITEEGYMGLGTNDPGRQVEIKGAAPIIRFNDTGGGYSEISANTAILSLRADAGDTQSNSYVDVQIDGALKAKFDSTGDLTISDGDLVIGTGGHGIDFSAQTPASGMTAEVLNHYEEGTWTPVLNGSVTATAQQCSYTRIGNQVFLIGKLKDWSTSTLSTDIQITGLPFTPNANGGTGPTVWHKGGDMGDHLTCTRTASSGYLRFLKSGSGSASWEWVEYEDLNSTSTEVYFSVAYPVA